MSPLRPLGDTIFGLGPLGVLGFFRGEMTSEPFPEAVCLGVVLGEGPLASAVEEETELGDSLGILVVEVGG